MTTRLDAGVTYTQSWDAQNRLRSVAAPAKNTAWVYDGDGARVSKNDGAVTTVYIGGSVEVQISGTLRLTTTYYFFGGARIAMRAGANVTFLHGDRLGSASLATDAAGNVLSQERYYVWGSASMMSGTMPTDFQWQNHPSTALRAGWMRHRPASSTTSTHASSRPLRRASSARPLDRLGASQHRAEPGRPPEPESLHGHGEQSAQVHGSDGACADQ